MKYSFKKTALATVVAGTLSTAAILPAQATVVNVSWSGAFTMLNAGGSPLLNSPSDYTAGFYANGSNSNAIGSPFYPGNVGAGGYSTGNGMHTGYGWLGNRTPVSGTMAFDPTNGVGTGVVNNFFFFGDNPGSGNGTHVARALGVTFQAIDTIGTVVGAMLFSWNGGGHQVSIVMDGAGFFQNMNTMIGGGPTSTISGVGSLAATETTNFGSATTPLTLPMGASPMVTKTLNALGCEGQTLAASVNAYTITSTGNVANCTFASDTIGGSPMVSPAFANHNANFDILSIHFDSLATEPTTGNAVPIPAAVWLFGSGLLGLVGIARRKKKA